MSRKTSVQNSSRNQISHRRAPGEPLANTPISRRRLLAGSGALLLTGVTGEAVQSSEGKGRGEKITLEQCVQGATWKDEGWPGACGIHRFVQMNLRRRASQVYATRYFAEHGRLPEGRHLVAVTYGPPGTADIVCPWDEKHRGRLAVEITYAPLRSLRSSM